MPIHAAQSLKGAQKVPRTRSKVNKNRAAGINNRQSGLCIKANSLYQLYNVDVAVVFRLPDGDIGGYQSKPGLSHELLRATGNPLLGPSDMHRSDYIQLLEDACQSAAKQLSVSGPKVAAVPHSGSGSGLQTAAISPLKRPSGSRRCLGGDEKMPSQVHQPATVCKQKARSIWSFLGQFM